MINESNIKHKIALILSEYDKYPSTLLCIEEIYELFIPIIQSLENSTRFISDEVPNGYVTLEEANDALDKLSSEL